MNHFALRKPQEIHFKGCWNSDEVGEWLLREIHPENAPSQAFNYFRHAHESLSHPEPAQRAH